MPLDANDFKALLKTFQENINVAQKKALDLSSALARNLPDIMNEGLTVPKLGKPSSIENMLNMSKMVGAGLTQIATARNSIIQARPYIQKLSNMHQRANEYLSEKVAPKLNETGDKLIDIGKKINEFSKKLPAGKIQEGVFLLGAALGSLGLILKGLASLIKKVCQFTKEKIKPAVDVLNSVTERVAETLQSNAESIREISEGVHRRSQALKKTLTKPEDIGTNQTLDKLAIRTTQEASVLVWSPMSRVGNGLKKKLEETLKEGPVAKSAPRNK